MLLIKKSLLQTFLMFSIVSMAVSADDQVIQTTRVDGYRGIWYSNQPSNDKYVYKYSGGLGSYCAKHTPFFQYVPEVNKTFFVYGGTKGLNEKEPLLIMVSYYDHETDMVPKPAVVMEKGTGDAHHNPTISIDQQGHLWIFASAHGRKDGFIFKSAEPYSIDSFIQIAQKEFTYPQPWYLTNGQFFFLFTKYTAGRELYFVTSANGQDWSADQKIAGFGGHYQISANHDNKIVTTFNWHPPEGGLNARTNLYVMQTTDMGKTWTTVNGEELQIPLSNPDNSALIREYKKEGLLVYMKDVTFDEQGNPVILYVTSQGYESGPENNPRMFTIAHWLGNKWEFKEVAQTDHNYDMGSLYIEGDHWTIIAPTEPGAQPFTTGGDIAVWVSQDQGETWKQEKILTNDDQHNHTYVRRGVNAHDEFYAFWADGNALKPSSSRLYFTNKNADTVMLLPPEMDKKYSTAKRVHFTK